MSTITFKSDTELKDDILSELRYEPRVKISDIGILVKDGTVTLNGFVSNYRRGRAEKGHGGVARPFPARVPQPGG